MRFHQLLGVAAVAAVGIVAMQIASAPSTAQTTLHVFDSVESCERLRGEAASCRSMEAEAKSVAEAMIWPFADQAECIASHGAESCYQGGDGRWRVKMAGFTRFSRDTAFRSTLPVFSSSAYPGLYLPNGYPVISGANTILDELLAKGSYMAGRPRSLDKELCVKARNEMSCEPLHTFVTGGGLSFPVVSALFSDKAYR